MKKILIIMLLLPMFIDCTKYKYKVVYSPSFRDDPERKRIIEKDKMLHPEKYETREDVNHRLDSLNALGCGMLVRGADRDYDTIIDHVQIFYRTVK